MSREVEEWWDGWPPHFDRTRLFYLLKNSCGAWRGPEKGPDKKRQSLDIRGQQNNSRLNSTSSRMLVAWQEPRIDGVWHDGEPLNASRFRVARIDEHVIGLRHQHGAND